MLGRDPDPELAAADSFRLTPESAKDGAAKRPVSLLAESIAVEKKNVSLVRALASVLFV